MEMIVERKITWFQGLFTFTMASEKNNICRRRFASLVEHAVCLLCGSMMFSIGFLMDGKQAAKNDLNVPLVFSSTRFALGSLS